MALSDPKAPFHFQLLDLDAAWIIFHPLPDGSRKPASIAVQTKDGDTVTLSISIEVFKKEGETPDFSASFNSPRFTPNASNRGEVSQMSLSMEQATDISVKPGSGIKAVEQRFESSVSQENYSYGAQVLDALTKVPLRASQINDYVDIQTLEEVIKADRVDFYS